MLRFLFFSLCFIIFSGHSYIVPSLHNGRIVPFGSIDNTAASQIDNQDVEKLMNSLKEQNIPPIKIAEIIEAQHPTMKRLKNLKNSKKVLPSKYRSAEWFPIEALQLKIYNPLQDKLLPISNFTVFSDELFLKLQTSNDKEIPSFLLEGYRIWQNSKPHSLPTLNQLRAEFFYQKAPLTQIVLALYLVGIILLYWNKKTLFFCAFALHTAEIALRCYILERPPVSNMAETVLYVPWVAVALAIGLFAWTRNRIVLIAGGSVATILLSILLWTGMAKTLDPVQPILNSQYWLIIHVLMVVGSYGAFALSAVLAHLYLLSSTLRPNVKKIMLQSLYLGVTLLATGTVLGGVWAAQSWGRFWDWDPKEAWAFISICIYLIFIHLYHRKLLSMNGIASASIIGFMFISFTWYGVNYLLGTGLHSYGFGTGGVKYYLLYITGEILFLLAIKRLKRKKTV